jgi:anti-sigma regulatory factor (Ser/Thr protein kinase)
MGSGDVVQWRAESFEADARSPARARAFVRETTGAWGFPSDDVMLVVSELVSNVVSHAESSSPFTVKLMLDEEFVHVSVTDPGSGWPSINPVKERSGRGLRIVEKLAADWGVRRNDCGKTVWADMPLQ